MKWRQQQQTVVLNTLKRKRKKKTQTSRNSTVDEQSTTSFCPPALTGVGGGAPLQSRACVSRGQRSSVFVCLYAEHDEVVGAAPGLLLQQAATAQLRRLARHRHVVRTPLLTVLVHHPVPPAGGAVPDALLWPDGGMTSRQ